MQLVEVRNVSFSYGSKQVLRDITLDICSGDYLGIIGPNGGGKTTLLKLILGLLKPTSGEIKYTNHPRIGYVAQKAATFDLNFPLSVRDVVSQGRVSVRGLFHSLTAADWSDVDKALTHVGLSGFQTKLIGDLSGGQQQRVFIARALVGEPQLIFLDEPTSGIDAASQEQFYTLLKKLNQELKITLVIVSHDIDVITKEVTHVAVINEQLVYHGPPHQFLKSHYLIHEH